ncbi:MAG: hypothetical protein P4L84_14620 [Isosphaeraceae bacterium]|nr:hypothetical protein [Isosphaeraceae bacterium]
MSVACGSRVAYTGVMVNRTLSVLFLGLVGLLLPVRAADPPGPLDVEPEELRPGLWAEYRSLAGPGERIERLEGKPAFCLGETSPHPALPDGAFEATWRGVVQLREPAPVVFRAKVGGELKVAVDGVTVLEGKGVSERSEIGPGTLLERPPGLYRLEIRYRSVVGTPARLQLFWESAGFAREPLPAWRLVHLQAELPGTFAQQDQRARGRTAAERLGCARCHARTFPGIENAPHGPSLADSARRLGRDWMVRWLEDPSRVRKDARMPALFSEDRRGYVERWIIADHLAHRDKPRTEAALPAGDHRLGRRSFLGLGCAACHVVPDVAPAEQGSAPDRVSFSGLGERFGAEDLERFLLEPRSRYPDGRMPTFSLTPEVARAISSYLLLWSPSKPAAGATPPSAAEVADVVRRVGVGDAVAAASVLIRERGCASCHPGLGDVRPQDVPIARVGDRGCLSEKSAPRFALDDSVRKALVAYLSVSPAEHPPSPVVRRREALERAGCVRCHQRDTDRPPPIEVAGNVLGGGHLAALPFQRTPRLNDPHQKFSRSYLVAAVRDGVSGLRPSSYTYRMPAFGPDAEALVRALAEQDGELPDVAEEPSRASVDPTLGSLIGPGLVGSQGYGCISCHVWNGMQLSQPDPGAVGPDLTRVPGRIRRDWFDRFLEGPGRLAPGTPMPAIFVRGQPALLPSVLGGDPAKQRDALWSYLTQAKTAPPPKPPPPLPIEGPARGEPPLVAQVPLRFPDNAVVESVCLLTDCHDLFVYDLDHLTLRAAFTGARILRNVQGRTRQFLADGTSLALSLPIDPDFQWVGPTTREALSAREFRGYDRLSDGVRLRWDARVGQSTVRGAETYRIERGTSGGRLVRELRLEGIPAGSRVAFKLAGQPGVSVTASVGKAETAPADGVAAMLTPDPSGTVVATAAYPVPAERPAPIWSEKLVADPGLTEGSLERPGYRAVALPRPKTMSGEDRIMPVALAVDPRDRRVFVASLKTGELFALAAPGGDRTSESFGNYGRGLFQDALSLLAEDDALYVLHRRNLTRVTDTDGDGFADRFDRVAALPHGVADTYDYAYGLVRDKEGAFVLSYAPYASTQLPGSGGAVRLVPGKAPREIAYGFRNPVGWCIGPEKELFFTDNQGEWVAANKLCHLVEGRFYGFPNRAQPQHAKRPAGRAAIWVPYGWARSINGMAYDHTGGKFGPFAGQFFLAELMFGGAIIRADVERVNGEFQGACFPFWGKGLMGPVSLAFDPRGSLYVGGITEPGWMAQPDRGALFRIDYTGRPPFEIQTIRVRPSGFRLVFTEAVDRARAVDPASYRVEHYRYEYTGAYGSPELDRMRDPVEQVHVSADGRSVELMVSRLVQDRIYMISAQGVRSAQGRELVHPTGAYTLNEVPAPDRAPASGR